MNRSRLHRFVPQLGIALLLAGVAAVAQNPPEPTSAGSPSLNQSLQELHSQVRELRDMVLQLQQQTTESRAEIVHLRQELESSRTGTGSALAYGSGIDEQSPAETGAAPRTVEQRIGMLEDDEQLLTEKVNQQYQTKVESASKYRVRFSGMVLVNLFGNSGAVDNMDVPAVAVDPAPAWGATGSIGGTLRQSVLGFEVFGPELLGAKTSGNVNLDFGGGFPTVYNGVNAGIVRLRTATFRLDWKNTSVIAGQDSLFISPNSPTSFASLIVPALSYAGNLWSWTPQLRVEHRFILSNDSTVSVQGGLLDPLTGEPPPAQWYRYPQAGEFSRAPATAARVSFSRPLAGRTLTLGASGYYSRESWGYNRETNGWAGMVDWNIPLDRWFTLSGLVYRGAGIGGLGGGVGRSVLYNGDLGNPATQVLPLNTVGGWAQLKYRPMAKLEFNFAFGQDNPFAADIRAFDGQAQSYGDPTLTRNRGAFGNVIYRPRSDLLFSLEYRRLRTFSIDDQSYQAGQVNLGMGVLF